MLLGIPRSLFFFYYNPFWTSLWRELEVECLVSPPTTPAILQQGLELALDEFCLPVKVHYGHLAYLENRVDLIFSPAFGRWGKRGHFCPKLKAIHDLVKHRFPRSIEFWHDLDENTATRPLVESGSQHRAGGKKKNSARPGRSPGNKPPFSNCGAGYNPAEAAAPLAGKTGRTGRAGTLRPKNRRSRPSLPCL